MKTPLLDLIHNLPAVKSTPIAVGVSCGADSLALILLLSHAGYNVTALSVDHGLRAAAKDEISFASTLMKQKNIPHKVLEWVGPKPTSNIQAGARKARYDLMQEWCVGAGVRHLCVAHHLDDQAETFLMRLARGSGVKGLSAMQAVKNLSKEVQLIRPLLKVPKADLINYLQAQNISWIEDPSNQNDDFDRVTVRNFLKNPPLAGFTCQRLVSTAENMQRAQGALDYYTRQWLNSYVDTDFFGYLAIDPSGFNAAPDEIVYRAISSVISYFGGQDYTPRFEKLTRLVAEMQTTDFSGATLAGVQFIRLKSGVFLVFRELGTLSSQNAQMGGQYSDIYTIDRLNDMAEIWVKPIGTNNWPIVKKAMPEFMEHIPHSIRLTMPSFWSASGEFLGAGDTVDAIHLSMVKPYWK